MPLTKKNINLLKEMETYKSLKNIQWVETDKTIPDSNGNVYFVLTCDKNIKTDLQDIHKIKAGTIAYQVSDGGYELGDGEYSYVEKNDIVNDIDWIRIDFSDVIETWYKGDLQKLYG